MSYHATRFRAPRTALRLARRSGRGARAAFLLAMVAQLVAVVIAPVVHASFTRPLAAHVEAPGDAAHQTHDDADCASCAVQHLAGRVERPAAMLPPPHGREQAVATRAAAFVPAPVAFVGSPRAPPVIA
jgi:hypothetical protein